VVSKAGASPPLDEDPRRLHPGSMAISVIRGSPSTLLGIPALVALIARTDGWVVVSVGVTAALAVAAMRILTWSRFTYALAADAVVIESGLFSRNRRTIPYERIADIGIERSPLQRVFGLAKVTLETGGSGADEGSLDSVSRAEPMRLRAALRGRREGAFNSPAIDAAHAASAGMSDMPFFAMSKQRVLIWGAFNFSLVWIAVGFGALQYTAGLLNVDRSAVWETIAASTGSLRTLPVLVSVGALASGSVLVLAIGVLVGIARTTMRDHGFRLVGEDGRLRRTRGLFTRSEAIISLPRVQLALVDNGLLRRSFGWARLRAQVLGGREGDAGLQDLAPLAREVEIAGILDKLRLQRTRPDALRAVARGHVWRALLRRTALPTLLILIAAGFYPPALIALTLLPPLTAMALLERRYHRYGLAYGVLQVQRGLLARNSWIVPITHIQGVTLRCSWLQRRLGLVSIHIDTAGGSRFGGPSVHDVLEADGWMLVELLTVDRHRYRDGATAGGYTPALPYC
jgi:putative membrane protein